MSLDFDVENADESATLRWAVVDTAPTGGPSHRLRPGQKIVFYAGFAGPERRKLWLWSDSQGGCLVAATDHGEYR